MNPSQVTEFLTTLSELGVLEDIERICRECGVTRVEHIRAETRLKHIARARHLSMAWMRARFPHMSYPALGRLFGRDHTTVIAAVRKVGLPTLRVAA